jgi:hypothetical protein
MPVTPNRVFIYGDYSEAPAVLASLGSFLGAREPNIAIEILREFSASELVGKVYVRGRAGNWIPVSQPGIREFTWYKEFSKGRLFFVTQGSDPWKVLYFRPESDETGPYVAIGLRLEG